MRKSRENGAMSRSNCSPVFIHEDSPTKHELSTRSGRESAFLSDPRVFDRDNTAANPEGPQEMLSGRIPRWSENRSGAQF